MSSLTSDRERFFKEEPFTTFKEAKMKLALKDIQDICHSNQGDSVKVAAILIVACKGLI